MPPRIDQKFSSESISSPPISVKPRRSRVSPATVLNHDDAPGVVPEYAGPSPSVSANPLLYPLLLGAKTKVQPYSPA
jgi:hypothetical protein